MIDIPFEFRNASVYNVHHLSRSNKGGGFEKERSEAVTPRGSFPAAATPFLESCVRPCSY